LFEHKHGIYSWWLPEGRIISSARAVASQYPSEAGGVTSPAEIEKWRQVRHSKTDTVFPATKSSR
jgi:hypothetical protein